jgi:hypothetical protein
MSGFRRDKYVSLHTILSRSLSPRIFAFGKLGKSVVTIEVTCASGSVNLTKNFILTLLTYHYQYSISLSPMFQVFKEFAYLKFPSEYDTAILVSTTSTK